MSTTTYHRDGSRSIKLSEEEAKALFALVKAGRIALLDERKGSYDSTFAIDLMIKALS